MSVKSAVFFAAHPWHGTPYGLHHVARALSGLGWRVLYVEPQLTPFHLVAGARRGRQIGSNPRPSGEPGIELLSPLAPIPHLNRPILRARWMLEITSRWNWPNVAKAVLRRGRPDLAIVGSPTFLDAARAACARVLVYRLADDSSLFPVISPAMREAEQRGLAQVDAVLASTPVLARRAEAAGARRVVMLPNGVDAARFARPMPLPEDMASLPRPIVLYVGAVERWFDWDTVLAAARAQSSRSFVIIGRVAQRPGAPIPGNVYLLGVRPYEAVPAYMQGADVGIVPFSLAGRDEAIQSINPLKIHEYLAAGLPVVSTIVPRECEQSCVFRYSGLSGFLAALEQALEPWAGDERVAASPDADWQRIVTRALMQLNLS